MKVPADDDEKSTPDADDLAALAVHVPRAAGDDGAQPDDDKIDLAALAALSNAAKRPSSMPAAAVAPRAARPWLVPASVGFVAGVVVGALAFSSGISVTVSRPGTTAVAAPPPAGTPAVTAAPEVASAAQSKGTAAAPAPLPPPAPAAAPAPPVRAALPRVPSSRPMARELPAAEPPQLVVVPAADPLPPQAPAPAPVPARDVTSVDAVLDDALSGTPSRRSSAVAQAVVPATPSREDVTEAMSVLLPAIRGCAMGETGLATAGIVVKNDGRVASVTVTGAPFAGAPSGRCMEGVVRRARFPRFQQPSFRVQFPFAIQ